MILGDQVKAELFIGSKSKSTHRFFWILFPLKFCSRLSSASTKNKQIWLGSRVVEFFTADDIVVPGRPLDSLQVQLDEEHQFSLVFDVVNKKAVFTCNGRQITVVRRKKALAHLLVRGALGILHQLKWSF